MFNARPSPTDPRALLDALRTDHELPGLPPEAVARARPWASAPAAAPPADVAALPEPLALALLEGAVQAGAAALAEALAGAENKVLAKAARKALYQLRSRGIAVASPVRPSAPEAPDAPPAEALPALLTSIDGTGERVLEIPRLLRGGGVEAIQVLTSDETGVTRLQVAEMNRGDYRRAARQATSPGPDAAVELPLAEALERLAQAAGLNLRTGTAFPPGLDAVLRHLDVRPREDAPPALPAPEPEDERLAQEAHALHDEEEMRGWLPPLSALEHLARAVAELRQSPLTLTPAQRNAELLGLAQARARDFLAAEPMRQLQAHRVWEMALHFERLGKQRPARLARAEARLLAHGPADRVSRFAERLFEKALLVTLAGSAASTARSTAEAPRPQGPAPTPPGAREGERRSPGGIILP
ncbi:hypothetical protein [Melittangium boletus]|uniref:hypothetical protein n=1 Tax=Melittangium boletus TaxID=83453 RepID=UPI003DA36383